MVTDKRLEKLSKLSEELNSETDAFNASIVALEKRLAAMNIGVSVWRCHPDGYICAQTERREGYPESHATISGWIWGYDKIGESWRIAVQNRTDTWEHLPDGVDNEGRNPAYVRNLEKHPPVPLVSAPRAVRLEAPGHVAALLDALERTMKTLLGRVKEAKQQLA